MQHSLLEIPVSPNKDQKEKVQKIAIILKAFRGLWHSIICSPGGEAKKIDLKLFLLKIDNKKIGLKPKYNILSDTPRLYKSTSSFAADQWLPRTFIRSAGLGAVTPSLFVRRHGRGGGGGRRGEDGGRCLHKPFTLRRLRVNRDVPRATCGPLTQTREPAARVTCRYCSSVLGLFGS